MSYRVDADVTVAVTWNDETNEWEVPGYELEGHLVWATEPTGHGGKGDEPKAYAAAERAAGHPLRAEDLAYMLGAALTQTVRSANVNVEPGYRPASPALVHMIEGAIDDSFQAAPHRQRDVLVQHLIPIIASVDMNAHLRGAAEALASQSMDGGTP